MTRKPTTEQYSIVVVGEMNPSLHHPAWYRHVGLIDEEEMKQAAPEQPTARPTAGSVVVPGFRFEAFEVHCFQNRWDIKTKSRAHLERIRTTTEKMFDEILKHTPVAAFGLNFEYGFDPGDLRVGEIVGKFLGGLLPELGLAHPDGGEVRIAETRATHTLNVLIRAGDEGKLLVVATNAHYQIAGSALSVATEWSIKEKLSAEFDPRGEEAERFADTLSARLLGA